MTHSIIHPSQFGCLRNRRTSDHICQPISKFQNIPGSYSLYIDFNKVFSTVPQDTLWKILERQASPKQVITLLRSFYSHLEDSLLWRATPTPPASKGRGFDQRAPSTPLLFVLHFNVLLFAPPPPHPLRPPHPPRPTLLKTIYRLGPPAPTTYNPSGWMLAALSMSAFRLAASLLPTPWSTPAHQHPLCLYTTLLSCPGLWSGVTCITVACTISIRSWDPFQGGSLTRRRSPSCLHFAGAHPQKECGDRGIDGVIDDQQPRWCKRFSWQLCDPIKAQCYSK